MLGSNGSQPSGNDTNSKFRLATFDPHDMGSGYFGAIDEDTAVQILLKEREDGVFLVRDNESVKGSLFLCVRESDSLVSNHLIEVKQDPSASPSDNGKRTYKIGSQIFSDIASLLNFYKLHYLESTLLKGPSTRQFRVRANFNFIGLLRDRDLSFKKGETLWVIQKDDNPQNTWWTARNAFGQIGHIAACYVKLDPELDQPNSSINGDIRERNNNNSSSDRSLGGTSDSSVNSSTANVRINPNRFALAKDDMKLPSYAKVIKERIPNAYDKSALRLKVGDRILVTKTDPSGTWEGKLIENGSRGHFPGSYVKWIDHVHSYSYKWR